MKKILMIATMATTLLVSCNNEDSPLVKSSNKELSFTVGGIASTKGIVDGDKFTDITTKIGIFAVNSVDEATESDYKPTDGNPFFIAEFHPTLKDVNTVIDDTKVWICGTEKKVSLSTQMAKIYAFYPYEADATKVSRENKTLKVDVSTSQDFTASSQKDYMFATKTATIADGLVTVNNASATANLFFHHALAKITFKVIKDPTYGATSPGLLKSIILSNAVTGAQFNKAKADGSCVINLETGAFANTEVAPTLTFEDLIGATIKPSTADTNKNGMVTDKDNKDFFIQGLVIPTAALPATTAAPLDDTNSIKITMNIDGANISGYFPHTVDKWEANKNYVYTITVTGTKLIISSTVKIVDWGTPISASNTEVN